MAADLSVGEAARRLGVNEARVRSLVAAGALEATKIGGRWLVDPMSVARRLQHPAINGRPLTPANAWAVLLLAAGELPSWLSPWNLSRLRGRVHREGLAALVPRLWRRAELHRLRAHPGDLRRILPEKGVVQGGVSAAGEHDADIVSHEHAEIYVALSDYRRLVRNYHLEPSRQPNLLVRVIKGRWPFRGGVRSAPAVVVAVDLMESDDPRSRRAGEELLRRCARD